MFVLTAFWLFLNPEALGRTGELCRALQDRELEPAEVMLFVVLLRRNMVSLKRLSRPST